MIIDDLNKKKIDLLITSSNNIHKKPIREINVLEKMIKGCFERIISDGGLAFITCFTTEQILEIIIVIENILRDRPEFSSLQIELYHTFK